MGDIETDLSSDELNLKYDILQFFKDRDCFALVFPFFNIFNFTSDDLNSNSK